MALKPTIYKFNIALTDLNREYYDSLNLTLAQHPSETAGRMLARVLAYCLEAQPGLVFTKGLSEVDEPDIWLKTLEGPIALWIDIGEPASDRLKKATRLSQHVKVYSFNSKSDVWWAQSQAKLAQLPLSVFQFNWQSLTALAAQLQRTMHFSLTISGQSLFIALDDEQHEIEWRNLQVTDN